MSHVAGTFNQGAAFDVNPVVWALLSRRGISLRGVPASNLGLDPEPALLRDWNLQNLNSYWRQWAASPRTGRGTHHTVAWGVLGAPRLHCTITTGEIVGKLAAGVYALEAFDSRWHPLINAALSYWRDDERAKLPRSAVQRAAEFVLDVIDNANRIRSSDSSEPTF